MWLLGGVGEVVRTGIEKGRREGQQRKINEKEIRQVVLKLRKEKSMGGGGRNTE